MSVSEAKLHFCPSCGGAMIPPRVSRSRYHEIYICSGCGTQEALRGDILKAKIARGYALPDQTGFNPYE